MSTTRITVAVELELVGDDPNTTFAAALRAVTERILASTHPLHANSSASGAAGAARWGVESWDERDLIRCISCQRMVPRAQTDITENGERCQHCTDQGQVEQHWLDAEQHAHDRGFSDGFFVGRWTR